MTTATIKAGDIIEIDGPQAKGSDGLAGAVRRFHALVVDNPGSGHVVARRLLGGKSFRVRNRLIVGHWRMSTATRRQHERESVAV